MDTVKKLVEGCRSFRRFDQDHEIDSETVRHLVDIARLTPSATNRQPLKYIISTDKETNGKIFSCLRWAALLNWDGPADGERATAYVIILTDNSIEHSSRSIDQGIAAYSILLGATEIGLGGCMIASIDRDKLRESLNIPSRFGISLVIALGKPKEEIVIDPLDTQESSNYWRAENGTHHVPKRKLEDVVYAEY